MNSTDLAYALNLAPEQAVKYFRSKGYAMSFDWQNVWQESQAKAFTVAKCMDMDVLADIRGAMDTAIADGQTLREFQDNLEPTLQAKGWWGKQLMTDPSTGQMRPVQLGSPRRLETIFRTNMAAAYSAGRYRDLVDSAETHPFWQFVCIMDSATRASHAALNGKVFRWDDPIWNTHFPPLDWGCRCRVRKLTAAQVRAKGLKVEASSGSMSWEERTISERTGEIGKVSVYQDPSTGEKISTGIGWSYNPGQAWQLDDMAWQKARQMPEEQRYNFIGEMAHNKLASEFFPSWVDGVLARGRAVGAELTMGWMPPKIWQALAAQQIVPASPIVVTNDKGILHMAREIKQTKGSALSIEEIKRMPEFIRAAEAVLLDKNDGSLLFVRAGGLPRGGSLKLVVRVDYKLKGRETVVNFARTSGWVHKYNLRESHYKLLWGKI